MKITKEMVTELNEKLEQERCSFKYDFIPGLNPHIMLVPHNIRFIDSYIINIDKDGRNLVNSFFASKGIELTYNNTGNVAWSKSGWSK